MIWRAFFAQRICDETCRRGVERISFACASTARPRDRLDGMEFERANRSKLGCRMGAQKLVRYSDKIADLRKTDPKIDWSDVKVVVGQHRVALWLSEVDSSN
jgi:hypothetical protein